MRRFLVIGLGRFRAALAEALTKNGGEVIAVDKRMELVPRLDYVLQKGDVLVLVGEERDLEAFTHQGRTT